MTQPDLTVVIDGRQNIEDKWEFIANFQQNMQAGNRLILLVTDTSPILPYLQLTEGLEIINIDFDNYTHLQGIFEAITTQFVAYIPTGLIPSPTLPNLPDCPGLIPWLPTISFPIETACESPVSASAWIISSVLLKQINSFVRHVQDYTLFNLVRLLDTAAIHFQWFTGTTTPNSKINIVDIKQSTHRRVLAIVPHYGCEPWLEQCLRSLLNQTRLPDAIVVVDDGSTTAPIEIVRQFPGVTLLTVPERSGPYRLIQQVIEDTDYAAYLFQDADDWSSCDRLQQLLDAMDTTGGELVGTQELRVLDSKFVPVCYPLDVNKALSEKPGHGLLHPTSLVTRDLVMRLGGFSTGLRFGGDSEFLLRAVLVARVINVPAYSYFRRKRSGSLTTDAHTGLDSPARQNLIRLCKERALANQVAVKAGSLPNLKPLVPGKPIRLHRVLGPKLSQAWG
jgi:hypothetical protein